MNPPIALIALSLLLLSACAVRYTDLDRDLGQLEAAPVCCAALADLRFEPVADEANFEFSIDEASPAFVFPDPVGKTFVRAFSLPPIDTPTRLRIRSFIMGNGPFDRHGYFMPLVTLLDADRRPIATTSPSMIRRVRENLFEGPNEGPTLEVNLVLTADTQVRHVLIHSAVPLLRSKIAPGGGETHIMPVPIGKGFMPMPVQSGGLISLEGTAKGRMRFTLYDYDGPMPEATPAAPASATLVQARSI